MENIKWTDREKAFISESYGDELTYLIDIIIKSSCAQDDKRYSRCESFSFQTVLPNLLSALESKFKLDAQIAGLPRGVLKSYIDKTKYKLKNGDERVSKNRHYYLIYDRKKHYVKRSELNNVQDGIIKRKELQEVLPRINNDIALGTKSLSSLLGVNIDADDLYITYSSLASRADAANEEHTKWIISNIANNSKNFNSRDIYSTNGYRVASKNEVVFCNLFHSLCIPVLTEPWIKTASGKNYYPDFCVYPLLMYKDKPIYIEIFGMTDDKDYLNNAISKIEAYNRLNIRQGDNLVCIFTRDPKRLNTTGMQNILLQLAVGKVPKDILIV